MTSRDTRAKNSSKRRPASTKKMATSRLTVNTINPIMDMAPRNTMSIFASAPTVRDSRMTAAPTKKTGTSQTAALMTRRSLRIAGWATTALT